MTKKQKKSKNNELRKNGVICREIIVKGKKEYVCCCAICGKELYMGDEEYLNNGVAVCHDCDGRNW